MFVRKPAVRTLDEADLQDASAAMLRQGFEEYDRGEGYVVPLRHPGKEIALRAERTPQKAVLEQQGNDVELEVRYDDDVTVVIDTGDLESVADRIVSVISG